MVIIDTTVWVDYLRGIQTYQTTWVERELSNQRLGLLDIILCEVLQGIKSDQVFEITLAALLNFEVFTTGGADLAMKTAWNFQFLRKHGYTVRKTIDCWIATFCLLNNHTLLHNDRDFEPFEQILGLQVIREEPKGL